MKVAQLNLTFVKLNYFDVLRSWREKNLNNFSASAKNSSESDEIATVDKQINKLKKK